MAYAMSRSFLRLINDMFQQHINFAHTHWQRLLLSGDTAIDATCGNGHDTLFLAKLALTQSTGRLFAIDIQESAIQKTKTLLQQHLNDSLLQRIIFKHGCHSKFDSELSLNSIKLIVYNLGYLPGGNKQITTQAQTTLQSIEHAMDLLMEGGLISITCYPGHNEGSIEQSELLKLASKLDVKQWACSHHTWLRNQAPSVLFLKKI